MGQSKDSKIILYLSPSMALHIYDVCIYSYMYIFICFFLYVSIHIYISIYIFPFVYINIGIYIYIDMFEYIYIYWICVVHFSRRIFFSEGSAIWEWPAADRDGGHTRPNFQSGRSGAKAKRTNS